TGAASPTFETAKFGEVEALHAVAVAGEDGSVTVFAVNRDLETPLSLDIDTGAMAGVGEVTCSTLTDTDPHAKNTLEDQTRVAPAANPHVRTAQGPSTVAPPGMRWNLIRIHAV